MHQDAASEKVLNKKILSLCLSLCLCLCLSVSLSLSLLKCQLHAPNWNIYLITIHLQAKINVHKNWWENLFSRFSSGFGDQINWQMVLNPEETRERFWWLQCQSDKSTGPWVLGLAQRCFTVFTMADGTDQDLEKDAVPLESSQHGMLAGFALTGNFWYFTG